MKRIKERFQLIRPLLVPLVLYIGLLALSFNLVKSGLNQSVAIAMAMLPMIPASILAVGVAKAINQLDELEKKIILEAAAISFMVTFLGMIALGQLDQIGISAPNPAYISLMMAVLVVIAKLAGNWKHK